MLRLIPCARVSSREQGDNGTSLDTQVAACRAYIARIGATALDSIAEDVSGITPLADRPRGRVILQLLAQDKADGVVWYTVDRFYRDDLLARLQVREWVAAGVRIHFTDSGECLSDSDLMLVMKCWMGADERNRTRERTVRGRYATAERGAVMMGQHRPYGFLYISAPHAGRLEIYEPEAGVVRVIYRWYIAGPNEAEATEDYPAYTPLKMRQIAYLLHDKRIPTYQDTTPGNNRKSGYADWQVGVVKIILTRRVYMGEWTFGLRSTTHKPVTVPVPAIIDPATFAQAQARVKLNAQQSPRNRRAEYLLSGMVTCACGARMFGKLGSGNAATRPLYYGCSSRMMPHDYLVHCDAPYFRADVVDADVWDRVKQAVLSPDALIQGIEAMQDNSTTANAEILAAIATCDHGLAALIVRDTRLLSMYTRGMFTDDQLSAEKADIDAERVGLASDRDELQMRLNAVVTTGQLQDFRATCAEIADGMNRAGFADRRAFLQLLDVAVVLRGDDSGKHADITIGVNGLRVRVD